MSNVDDNSDFDDLDDEIVDGEYVPKINNLQGIYISLLQVLWLLFLT